MRSSKVLTCLDKREDTRLTWYKCNQDTIPHFTETGCFWSPHLICPTRHSGIQKWVTSFYTQTLGMHALVSSLMFPPSCSPDTGTREVFMRGEEWERNAVRWKKRRESESEGSLFVRIMPLRCFPRSRRELPGPPPHQPCPPPCLKAFFLSSSHPSLPPKESILCPIPSSPQNNRPLLWKKKTDKKKNYIPLRPFLPASLMDPFSLRPVKSTSSLICCIFHIPSACRVGCMDGGNTHVTNIKINISVASMYSFFFQDIFVPSISSLIIFCSQVCRTD